MQICPRSKVVYIPSMQLGTHHTSRDHTSRLREALLFHSGLNAVNGFKSFREIFLPMPRGCSSMQRNSDGSRADSSLGDTENTRRVAMVVESKPLMTRVNQGYEIRTHSYNTNRPTALYCEILGVYCNLREKDLVCVFIPFPHLTESDMTICASLAGIAPTNPHS
jgi:hypothetical protein